MRLKVRMYYLLAVLSLFCSSTAMAALPRSEDLVKAKLLSDVAAIQPGKPFHVGVLLTIEKGWHIYWKNPGESGVATRIDLSLPDGYKQSQWQFPVPHQFQDAGGIVMNGYSDEVMLIAEITPTNLSAGGRVKLQGKASWLVCAKTCIPGKADLSIDLPVADESSPANSELFSKWMERLPKTQGLPIVQSSGTIEVSFPDVPKKVEWFIDPGEDANISGIKVQTRDRVSKITFNVEPAGAKPLPPEIEVVVGYVDASDKHGGQVIRHPLARTLGLNR